MTVAATQQVSADCIRAAAAVLVLLQGPSAPLLQLLAPCAGDAESAHWQRALCEGPREHRARGLAAVLSTMAIELDDWGLR